VRLDVAGMAKKLNKSGYFPTHHPHNLLGDCQLTGIHAETMIEKIWIYLKNEVFSYRH